MPSKFLIEVPHDANTVACARVVDVFLKSGSHFLSRADWGCRDGDHRAWMIVSVDSREDAERWMSEPVMGLDGARPVDLMRTVQGTGLVSEFLVRLEHGVYT